MTLSTTVYLLFLILFPCILNLSIQCCRKIDIVWFGEGYFAFFLCLAICYKLKFLLGVIEKRFLKTHADLAFS